MKMWTIFLGEPFESIEFVLKLLQIYVQENR